jgi:lipopolysaccharide export LptBFGC system permease protein LptF
MANVFRNISRALFIAVLLAVMALTVLSCGGGGPKKSASMKKIERQSRRNPAPTDMEATAKGTKNRAIKKAIRKQEQQKRDAAKAAEEAEKKGNKRHREAQTEETLKRMDENRKLSEQTNRNVGITRDRSTQKETYKQKKANNSAENTGLKKEKKRKKK